MNIESNETHHVFTDDEVTSERKKISYRIESSIGFIGLNMAGLWIVLEILLMWAFRSESVDPFASVYLAGILTFAGVLFTSWVSDPVDHLKPLSTEGFKSLQELSEANPSVAVWIAEALEDGRMLRQRDLWAAKVMDRQRRALESQHEAEQAERAALLDLRDRARDTVMSRQTV